MAFHVIADLHSWLAKHVRQWAKRLNFPLSACEFLEDAGVCGDMLDRPEEEVVSALVDLSHQRKAQGQPVPDEHVLRRLGQQAQRLRQEAKRIAKGRERRMFCSMRLS